MENFVFHNVVKGPEHRKDWEMLVLCSVAIKILYYLVQCRVIMVMKSNSCW